MNTAARFWAKVDRAGPADCWLWVGRTGSNGYGLFDLPADATGNRRTACAHRWAYEYVVGAIPGGLELDHLCRVRACVNPAHLEPVTHAENIARSPMHNAAKTHCVAGHPYDQQNTRVAPDGRRYCRACNRERQRQRRRMAVA